MGKRGTQPGLVIPELALGNRKVASGLVALGLCAAEEALDGVEDGARAVGVPRQWCRPPERALHVHVQGALWMLYQAKTQTATHTEGHMACLHHERRQRVQTCGEGLQRLGPV